jgi:hypothetical protein
MLAIAMVGLTSACTIFNGKDGKVYATVSYYGGADGILWTNNMFASGSYPNTEYEITAGTFSGQYVLYYTEYNYSSTRSTYEYETFFNVPGTTGYFIYGGDAATNISWFRNNRWGNSSYSNSYSFSITVNAGTFKTDGADKHYSIYLGWSPSNSTISSSNLAKTATIVSETSDKIVKELVDGDTTVRLEISKNPVTLLPGQADPTAPEQYGLLQK